MSQQFDVIAISTALSPITHMSGSHGNEQVVNREVIACDDGLRAVPCLSGNALRYRCVREPAAQYLVDAYGLKGRLTINQLNFLFHGGALTEKGGRVSLAMQADLFRLFPFLRLLGCSLPGQIVPGRLQVHIGSLVCRENASRLNRVLPQVNWPKKLRAAVSLISPYTYYRHEATKSQSHLLPEDGDDTDHAGMIFAGQSIVAGSVFVHGFTLTHGEPLEIGALLHSLQLWVQQGATIGSQSARGHGRLRPRFVYPADLEGQQLVELYRTHVDQVRQEAVEFLDTIFAVDRDATPAAKKPSKRKTKK